jgi:hypothetical protein
MPRLAVIEMAWVFQCAADEICTGGSVSNGARSGSIFDLTADLAHQASVQQGALLTRRCKPA